MPHIYEETMPIENMEQMEKTHKHQIGDRIRGSELGFRTRTYYIWRVCLGCGSEDWVRLSQGKAKNDYCRKCCGMHGSENPQWKGGWFERPDGYVFVKLAKKDFFRPMAGKSGYVMEHRLVMARKLGRCLQGWEKVHHKDGLKSHNEEINLELTTLGSHSLEHNKGYKDGYAKGLADGRTRQIEELKEEIRLLRWQLKEKSMPIKDLSEAIRIPRLGKIHLGIKTEKGYPAKTDYFVLPKDNPLYSELVKVFGEKPKALRILIPTEDEETWAEQYYRSYDMTHGLVCKGDGVEAMRMVDVATGDLANKATKTVALKPGVTCEGKKCALYQAKKCHERMQLRFLLPEIPGLGVWQIDTGSINSILNINSCAAIIRSAFKRLSLIPLSLTLEPIEVSNPESGKRQTVYVLNLRTNVTIMELADKARQQAQVFRLEPPDDTDLWDNGDAPAEQVKEVTEPPPPEAAKPPAESSATTQTEQKPPVTPATSESQGKGEDKPALDLDWLKEALAKLQGTVPKQWGTAMLVSRMQKMYGINGTDAVEMAQQLDKGKLAHFCKAIQESLDML